MPIKEAPIKHQLKKYQLRPIKEVPVKQQLKKCQLRPIKEVPIKAPIKEVPIKETPIKEVPKTPYTPKMPLQIIPEIDINNYYLNNMTNMEVKQPKLPTKPTNILPEVKVPQKEYPVMPEESPMFEQPQMQPQNANASRLLCTYNTSNARIRILPATTTMVSAASLSTNVIYAISTGSRSSNATNA